MVPELFEIIGEYGVKQVFPMILIAVLRTFGLLFGFLPFLWAFGQNRVLRLSLALAIGFPTLAASLPDIERLVSEKDYWTMAAMAPKEVALGLLLGLFMSLPFLALRYAGMVIATYKGEADGGIDTPARDGTISSVALLFEIIAMAAFVYAGGVWLVVTTLYASYEIWPLISAYPSFSPAASAVMVEAVTSTLLITVRTALPVLSIMIFVDFVLAVGGRIGRRYQLGDLSFASKNLIALMLFPLMTYMVWMFNTDIDQAAREGFDLMQDLLE